MIVDLGGRLTATCAVARTAEEQARGLQGRPPLGPGEGLLFPFTPPRATTFHMGDVSFPIDIVFLDARRRVAKVVTASPGSKDRWSHPVCAAVLELAGGACAAAGIEPGCPAIIGGPRHAAPTSYNLLRSLSGTDVDAQTEHEADTQPLIEGYYAKEPPTVNPGASHDNPVDAPRFTSHNPHDAPLGELVPPEEWEYHPGYFPLDTNEEPGAARRPSAGRYAAPMTITDPAEFIGELVRGMLVRAEQTGQSPIPWQEDITGATKYADVGPADFEYWMAAIEGDPALRQAVVETAASHLRLLGFALQGLGITNTYGIMDNGMLRLSKGIGDEDGSLR